MSRLRFLRPHLPSMKAMKFSTARSSFRWAKSAFLHSGPRCPNCGAKVEIKEITNTSDTSQVDRVLICTSCDFYENVATLMEHAVGGIERLRVGERKLFITGLMLFLGASILSFFNKDILTFFGGAVFALVLMQRALLFRYRAWQVTNSKLYSEKPPVREWLKDEFKVSDK